MAFARVLAVVLLIIAAPTVGRAGNAAAENFIQKLAEQALALVTDASVTMPEKRARFDVLLGDYFDMEGIGRFLLGRYWRATSPDEAYLKAFKENIVYTSTNRFDEYSGQKLAVDGSREDGQFTLVNSRIVSPNSGADVHLDWRLIKQGDNFKVVDVVIEGVSMSVTQRQEYASVIQSSGGQVKALIKALNDQMARLRSSNS